jgi:hypothetical protein
MVHDTYASGHTQLGDYSVPAAVVHGHLVDLLAHGRRTFDREEQSAPRPVLHLLDVGRRFSPSAGGMLDSSGSTARDLSLAQELRRLVQALDHRDVQDVDMQEWTRSALRVIERVEKPDAKLEDLAELREFAEGPLLQVLERIMDLPASDPAE